MKKLQVLFVTIILFYSCRRDSINPSGNTSTGPLITNNNISTVLASGQGGPPFTYSVHAPIALNGASNITISNYNITGGSTYCIFLINCHDVHITKNYCQGAAKPGIFVQNCYNIYIDSNFVTNSVVGIEAYNCTNNIRVVYNQLLNIASPTLLTDGTGNSIEFYRTNGTGLEVDSNSIEHTLTAPIDGVGNGAGDNIDFYQCSGTATSNIRCFYNWIRGGGTYVMGNGRDGISMGDVGGNYQDCEYNILVNTGWAGIQQGGGTYVAISNNKIYSDALPWSLMGLHSFTVSGIKSSCNNLSYNQIRWNNGYNGGGSVNFIHDTLYSAANSNPRPWGFTTNMTRAQLTPRLLPTTMMTFIATQ